MMTQPPWVSSPPHRDTHRTATLRPKRADVPVTDIAFLPWLTDRLTLHLHTESDLDALLEYYQRPEVARFLLESPWTLQRAQEALTKQFDPTGLDGPARDLALIVEHDGQIIGDIALWVSDGTGQGPKSVRSFIPTQRDEGSQTEAAAAVLKLGFKYYGLHRITADMDARNTSLAALCERLGMTREAHVRQDWWSKGEWTDTSFMAHLAQISRVTAGT